MNQNIYINEIPSAELTIYDNGTPVTVVIANGAVSQNKVPYTGATQNVNLGEYGISAGFVQLDTTPTTYTPAVGNMGWNDSEGTIDLLLKGGVVSLPLGQKQVARVVNGTGGNVLKSNYQVVKVTGAQGQRLQVNLAQANNDANSADTLGLIAENINNNNSGFIITSGLVENINTTGSLQSETWTDGNILYLSPTTPGAITNVKPQAPNHTVIVGFVVYAHANNGKIFVKVDNGYELDELHNVLINTGTLANGQVLKYNSSLQVWENNSDAGGITGTGTSGQVAYWNGTTTQTGSNNLFWDAANNRLGVGTNSPSYRLHIVGTGGSSAFNSGDSNDAIRVINRGFIAFSDSSDVLTVRFRGISGAFQFQDNLFNIKTSISTSNSLTYFNNGGGNVHIGGATDSGQRLQVTGDTLLKGSGNTSGTTALTVQNSDATNLLRILNDGKLLLGSNASGAVIHPSGANGILNTGGLNTTFYTSVTTQNFGVGAFHFWGTTLAPTSGFNTQVSIDRQFAPISGTAQMFYLTIAPVINQTGGANGITRGLYVNPTLTAAADWRSIEWSNNTGWGLYGAGTANNYVAGNLSIATTNTPRRLNIQVANGSTAAAIGLYTGGSLTSVIGLESPLTGDLQIASNSAIRFYSGSIIGNIVTDPTNERARFFSNGNFAIGTTTDAGFKLDVNGTARVQNDLTISDTRNIILETTTGTKIGTATSQKLGFWNATPIVQPTTGVASATRVGGGGTTLTDTDTFDGYTLAQIVKALRNTGILA